LPPPDHIVTNIPHRLDRLPWSRWHWLIVVGLGVTWILDGLEVTLAGTVGGVLKETLRLSDAQVGTTATCYLGGAVIGALVFGYATDRLGRKKLFIITLLVYLTATLLTSISWNFWSYAIFRAFTGMGIGGEYAAINSAIDELIPARVRGQVDLMINSTYWIGAALGAGATIVLLNPAIFPPAIGWRAAFALGAMLGSVIIFIRRFIPESPRWLMTHGRDGEAEAIVAEVESIVEQQTGQRLPAPEVEPLTIRVRKRTPWREIWRHMLVIERRRSLLSLTLMASQAFFYNAIFFTYALLLIRYYGVRPGSVGRYLLPFSLANVAGPFLLGKLFDSVGRRPMIAATYAITGLLLAASGWLFVRGALTAVTQTAAWSLIFFVASCAASSAYLTASEIFPLEIRAIAISIFYSIGTLVVGVAAPAVFGELIGSGSRTRVFAGYLVASLLLLIAALVEAFFGIDAERKSLEEISTPLAAMDNSEQARD